WRRDEAVLYRREFAQPKWDGSQDLDGKTILLYAEQGFGDTIQFCRYTATLAARGARVVLEVPQPLQVLLASTPGVAQIVTHLAGAIGAPVWVLLAFSPDWRWLLERADSPWYPSAKLYRQPALDDWESVIARVRFDLCAGSETPN